MSERGACGDVVPPAEEDSSELFSARHVHGNQEPREVFSAPEGVGAQLELGHEIACLPRRLFSYFG